MKTSRSPLDGNILVRYLHLHTLMYVFYLSRQDPNKDNQFPQPGFDLFRPIPHYYKGDTDRYKLFKNILIGYRWQISIGILLTVIYASLNLLLSQIIKQFMEIMQSSDGMKVSSAVAIKFIVLQLLRMVFGIHMKRIFQQLALQVQSTISKRLIKKALLMDPECRRRIPQTQIFQLQNVDLKLIYNIFTILYLAVEIPFTIGVAIIWLFMLNAYLGFIALYWFLIIFLLQRALDDRMQRCNLTKLRLIDKRSKLNYQFLQKITLARAIRAESLLVQKNNDFFLQQNHDHKDFYRYASFYDIAQLLLPIAVVVTAALYDQNSKQSLTVQQLYLILSLLGICYRPMKDFRTFSIALSDGFHSLRRLTDYLELPEEQPLGNQYKRINLRPAQLTIANGTTGRPEGMGFQLQIKFHIEMKQKQRYVILGRKGQGSSTFLNMLVGQIKLTKGQIQVQGKIAYLSQENFFLIDTLNNNLAFFNESATAFYIDQIYKQLGLNDELRLSRGLNEIIEINKYNQNQLKMMSLARVFCSNADIYILDSPFSGLNAETSQKVQKILRRKQSEGVLVIMTLKKAQHVHEDDNVIIMHLASTKQVGTFKQLSKNPRSYIDNFLKNKQNAYDLDEDQKNFRRIALQFQAKVKKSLMYTALFQKASEQKERKEKIQKLVKVVSIYSAELLKEAQQRKLKENKQLKQASVGSYFLKFLRSCNFSQTVYILIIIIAVEVLHIFIHFYIGHQYEHRAKSGIKAIRTLMLYEGILTLGLAGLIYLEGEVSSYIAVMTGNKLYKGSIQALVHKQIRWYGEEYSLRTADKFNHDYEQIFITVHGVLTLYKNAVILIATALFVGGSHSMVLIVTIAVALLYFSILTVIRKAHSCILKHYYDYKYEFVKVFNESIEGAPLIKIYGVANQVVQKGKDKYTKLASYKLGASYIGYGQSLLCDLASTIITAIALQYGANIRLFKKTDIAVVATSILLLLNLADVLKAILDAAIQVQTFFRLNILPFMQIDSHQNRKYHKDYPAPPTFYDITFDGTMLKQQNQEVFEIYPLRMHIEHGEHVCIYEEDESLRDNLLYSFTKNIKILAHSDARDRTVFIGNVPICDISSQTFRQIIGIIMHQNFFLSGTLKQNLKWRVKKFDEQFALKLAKQISLGDDIKHFSKLGLEVNLQERQQQFSSGLAKKIAVLRVLLRKPKIVIIKDTPPFIGKWSIVELLNTYNPGCTIIKITNNLQVAYDMQRIIYLDHLKVVEDGKRMKFLNDRLSKMGEMLRNCNSDGYLYRNRVSMTPRHKKQNHLKSSHLLHSKLA